MEKTALVSILMTAYNREEYIAEAIQSVLASTYTNFELIIVDDCSIDNTVTIIRQFQLKDNRIKLFINEKNIGDYPNRNKAAEYASGKYLKYVDSDDKLYANGLEYCVACIERFEISEWGIWYPYEIADEQVLSPTEAIHYHFFERPFLNAGPGGTIIKRDFFFKLRGFPLKYGPANDMFFNLHAASMGNVVIMKDDFFLYRKHIGQEINNDFSYLYNNCKYLKDALESLNLPLDDNQIQWLQKKRKRRFAVNIILYFLKTGNLKRTKQAISYAEFSFKDFISGICHFNTPISNH